MQYKGKTLRVGDHIDTDVIIPARYLTTSDPKELGANCMSGISPDWVKQVQPDDILVGGINFGCGSSREHAPWALTDYGFRVVIAPSFADIFYGNSFNNQLLPVKLPEDAIDALFDWVQKTEGAQIIVDLENQKVIAGELEYPFSVDTFRRHCMMNGLDSIGLTLQHDDMISRFEEKLPAFMN